MKLLKFDHNPRREWRNAFTLIEVLVYMSVLILVMSAGYAVMYRGLDNAAGLRRSTGDIARALEVGERWRADVREATNAVRVETIADAQILRISTARGEVAYQFSENTLQRRLHEGPWTVLLPNVKHSAMSVEAREKVSAYRWELELQTRRNKPARVRPLFTFLAAPPAASTP